MGRQDVSLQASIYRLRQFTKGNAMQARDIMSSPVITAGPQTEVQEIAKLLLENRISGVPIVDDARGLIGIVSEGDLIRHAGAGTDPERRGSWWLALFSDPVSRAQSYVKHHGRFAREVMTHNVVTVSEDATLPEIAAILEKKGIKRVPVLRDGQVVGIISRANVLHGLATAKAPATVSRDDNALRAALNEAVVESGIRTTFLNIVVTDGIAHLWGAMESKQEREALIVIIENVDGLKGIENHVKVFPPVVLNSMGAV